MDSPISDASPDKVKIGPSFRKLSSDAANRTYRRPTNASQSDSSSSDENDEHDKSQTSPKDSAKVKVDERDVERRRPYGRTDKDRDRYSDRYSYRESRRHEDRDRRRRDVRYGDESSRDYARSSRSERSDNLDHKDKSKDREKDHDRYTGRRKDLDSGRDRYYKERDNREYYADRRGSRKSPERYDKNEKVKEKSRYRETDEGEMEGVDKRKEYRRENENRKRSEPESSFGQEEKQRRRETKFSKPVETNEEEKAGSSSKHVTEASKDKSDPALPVSNVGSQAGVGADIDAAKVAAMKAAEFVNRNIGGGSVGGQLTTEQKKKLLWGNKKNESSGAETVKGWNNLFTDRERQEKFNKLMGVKGDVVPEDKPEEKQGKSREELDMDLEKQYTAGLRRRDGRTVGLGL